MKSINRRFIQQREDSPNLADYANLQKAVVRQGFSKQRITAQFDELVPKDDYSFKERKELVNFLFEATQNTVLRD